MTLSENAILREQIAVLEERLLQLKAEFSMNHVVFPAEWNLTRANVVTLRLLLRWPLVTESMWLAIMHPEGDTNDLNMLRSAVCRLRRKLPAGVDIRAIHGEGYGLSGASRDQLLALLSESGPAGS